MTIGVEWMSNSKSPKAPCLGTKFTHWQLLPSFRKIPHVSTTGRPWRITLYFSLSLPVSSSAATTISMLMCFGPHISANDKRIGLRRPEFHQFPTKSSMYHQQFQPSEFWESLNMCHPQVISPWAPQHWLYLGASWWMIRGWARWPQQLRALRFAVGRSAKVSKPFELAEWLWCIGEMWKADFSIYAGMNPGLKW